MNKYKITGIFYRPEWVSEILYMRISTQNTERKRERGGDSEGKREKMEDGKGKWGSERKSEGIREREGER